MNQTAIALELGVDKSTISRELTRNIGGNGYHAKQAQLFSDNRRKMAEKHIKMTSDLKQTIREQLCDDWSPDQIAGRLKQTENILISHESIYKYILEDKDSGGELYKHLRHFGKKRKKRYGSPDRRGQIKNRVSIEKRPMIVDKKTRIGDWEGDTVIGKNHKGALVTLVDRVSKVTLIAKVSSKEADGVTDATIKMLGPYANFVRTITFDNGKEFSGHEIIAKRLAAKVYFAHPYSSWERGLNENTNGLIRQYVPKGSSFDGLTHDDVHRVSIRLNNRPRKSLGYLTPNELLFKRTGVLIS